MNRIMDLGDPEEMTRRLDDLDRRMSEAAARFEELDRVTDGLLISETDAAGVTATVNTEGQVVELITTPAITKLPPEQIGPTVLACIKRAQGRISAEYRQAAEQTGAVDDLTRHVVEAYRQRWPEQDVEVRRESGRPGTLALGEFEDD